VRRITLAMMTIPALLQGCGWHLQGNRALSANVSPVYLDLIDAHSEFATALTRELRTQGITFATSADGARVVVHVTADSTGHHVSAVSALNEPQQYEVYYTASFHISEHSNGSADISLAPIQTSSLSRTMNYDKTAALAMQRQEQVLQQLLAEGLAEQVVRKLGLAAAR
jgi:outer membrane lipopolysaccharide assembly protein LptE/RlpB